MKIIGIFGSPRREANSTLLGRRVLETARGMGAETGEFTLTSMRYSGCTGCGACKKVDHCVINDDLKEVLAAVRQADAVVFASPVYYGDTTGQFKCFFDRTYSFLNHDFTCRFPKGKKGVFVLTQGDPDKAHFAGLFPRYEHWLKSMYGFVQTTLVHEAGLLLPGEVAQRSAALADADAAARALL